MKKRYSLLWLLVITLSCQVDSEPKSVEELIGYYEENALSELRGPLSGAFMVAIDDSILYKGAVNYANHTTGELINPDTRFYIGSVSKQFTACLVLMLAREGKLDIHEPVARYLPGFSKGNKITAHQLLSHTSGLPHYPAVLNHGYTRESFFGSPITVSEYMALIGKMDLRFEPGSNYEYSSLGYDVLGAIIESITGNSYADELRLRITDPLGLRGTGYDPAHLRTNYAEDYAFDDGGFFSGGSYSLVPERELSTAFAGGGIYSTLNDLDKWSVALVNNELLGEKYTRLMFTPVLNGAAYGINRNEEDLFENDPSSPFYAHFGGIMGYSAAMVWYDDGTRVIALFNTSPLKNRTEFITNLHLAAVGRDAPLMLVAPELDDYRAFQESGGIGAFEQYYQDMTELAGYDMLPSLSSHRELISLLINNGGTQAALSYFSGYIEQRKPAASHITAIGYEFLQRRQVAESLVIFERNVQLYPDCANCHDSLGEALESKDELEKAREAYAAAVSLEAAADGANLAVFKDNLARAIRTLEDQK